MDSWTSEANSKESGWVREHMAEDIQCDGGGAHRFFLGPLGSWVGSPATTHPGTLVDPPCFAGRNSRQATINAKYGECYSELGFTSSDFQY